MWSISGMCRRFSGIPIILLSMAKCETLPILLVLVGWEALSACYWEVLSVCCICFVCADGSMFSGVFVSFVANTELRQERVRFSQIYEYMVAAMFCFWLFFEYVTSLVLSSWLYFCCLCCSQPPANITIMAAFMARAQKDLWAAVWTLGSVQQGFKCLLMWILLCCSDLLKSWLWNWVMAVLFSDPGMLLKSLCQGSGGPPDAVIGRRKQTGQPKELDYWFMWTFCTSRFISLLGMV